MLKVGLLGCGAIGRVIAESICAGTVNASLEMVYDTNKASAETVCSIMEKPPRVADSMEAILDSEVDLVVEAASVGAAREVAIPVLEGGKDLMILSVGALAEGDFYQRVQEAARAFGRKVYIPSGAIGALDALRSASGAALEEVTLTTTKHPEGFRGAPYLVEKGIEPEDIKEKTVIFEGSAMEAIQGFPANTNVAVALGISGMGVEKTRVKVIADPTATRNTHEIHVKGDFGEFTFKVENTPSPHNPRTSYLAALSAVATLKKITSPIQVGT